MARPTKDPKMLKGEHLTLRLTITDAAYIQEQAYLAGLTKTEFARRAILGAPMTIIQSDIPDLKTRTEIRRIGTNLNQMTRAFNAGQIPVPERLGALVAKLDSIFDYWLQDGSTHYKSGPQL